MSGFAMEARENGIGLSNTSDLPVIRDNDRGTRVWISGEATS
jgi:hypothetical protein